MATASLSELPSVRALVSGSSRKLGQQIVVLDRGFIYVGDVTVDGDFLRIENAKCIRKWGTSKGLGQLRNGPTPDTVLDDAGEVVAPMRALIHFVSCKGF
jgi:hypothetical protein